MYTELHLKRTKRRSSGAMERVLSLLDVKTRFARFCTTMQSLPFCS